MGRALVQTLTQTGISRSLRHHPGCYGAVEGAQSGRWLKSSYTTSLDVTMEATVLRPLRWFGLLDYRQDDIPERRFDKRHFYRKTPLFDRFVSFDVKLEAAGPRR